MSFKQKIPNALTGLRIAVIPLIYVLVFVPYAEAALAAFALFILAAVSDFLDGYLARIWQAKSVLGRVFDPIADKLLVGAVLMALIANGTIVKYSLVPATLILLRELLVSGVREYLGPLGITLPVSDLAKWKTTAQLIALALLLVSVFDPVIWYTGLGMLWMAAGLTVWTGWEYMKSAWGSLTRAD